MKRQYRSFDFLLVALVAALAVFGLMIIGSATSDAMGGYIDDFYAKQKFWVASGLVILIAAAFIDYHFICKFHYLIYAVNIGLLILAVFLGNQDGTNTGRWIRYGGFGIQPSEFTKIFMIIFLATFLDKKSEVFNKPHYLALLITLIAIPVVFIVLQPSLSAAIVVSVVSVSVLFVGKLSYKYILPVIVLTVPMLIFFYIDFQMPEHILIDKILTSYQMERIDLWLNPDVKDPKYYQTLQSIHAIGSGQLEGKGLNQGTINVPMAHNDFIFAVIGEEFGFYGCILVLGVLLLITLKCMLIASRAVDMTGRLIASGAAAMIASQTFVNVGVATGLLPNTGTPLPFVSYGGSSMWVCMVAVGLCVNVGMTKAKSFFET